MRLLIRRLGTLVDVSPDGRASLPQEVLDQLAPHLTYDHKQILRGHQAWDHQSGLREGIQIQPRNLFRLEQGRLTTGYGFIPKILRILQAAGHDVRFIDLSPPRERPDCYEPDWANLTQHFNPRPRQIECLEVMDQVNGGIINATMGFGKAQPVTARVLTPSGWRRMGDLRVGDFVIGSDGAATRVNGVFYQGLKDVASVHFSDEVAVLCCLEHLWSVQTASQRYQGQGFQTLTTAEIADDLTHPNGDSKWFVPVVQPVQFTQAADLPLDPYLLGCLLGDGALTRRVGFSSADQELLDILAVIVEPMGLHLQHYSAYDYGITHGKKNTLNPIWELLGNLGIAGKKSTDKFIPAAYKYAGITARIECLRGLMDTDGTISDDSRRYAEFGSVASQQLAEDLCEMVRSLGGVTRVQIKDQPEGQYYRVRTNLSINLFRLSRKADLWKGNKQQGRTKAIRAVAPAGRAECVCISVAAEDGQYVTEGYTITHNTHMFTAVAWLYPRAKIAIVVKPKDVAERIVRRLTRHFPNVGHVGGGKRIKGERITVYTAGSMHHSDGDYDILLCDEAHQLMSGKHSEDLGRYFRQTRNFGYTATPEGRLDGAHVKLEMFFGPEVFQLLYPEAVQLGLVVPIRVRWLPINMQDNPAHNKTGVTRMRWGIWRNQLRNSVFAADVRAHYGADDQVLMAVATVDHAIHMWNLLPEFTLCYSNSENIDFEGYKRSGMLPERFRPITSDLRDSYRTAFEEGSLKKVIATDVWSTGVDFEQLQVLYRLDARESEILNSQWPGRVSRISDGKGFGEIVDGIDYFDKTLSRKSVTRKRHYGKHEWTQDWPTARRQNGIINA